MLKLFEVATSVAIKVEPRLYIAVLEFIQGRFLFASNTSLNMLSIYFVVWKPANKKSSPKWDLLQGNLAEGGEKEVQHK